MTRRPRAAPSSRHPPAIGSIGRRSPQWYVWRNRRGGEWDDEYLHPDGVWRETTQDRGTGEWSGYYETEAGARAALERFTGRGR